MSSSHFYVTLPSNSDKDGSSFGFRFQLAERIKLVASWEVGLSEIVYLNNCFNIKEDDNLIRVDYFTDNDRTKTSYVEFRIEAKCYTSMRELTKLINYGIETLHHNVVKKEYVSFDTEDGLFKFYCESSKIHGVYFTSILARMVGINLQDGWPNAELVGE